MPSSSSGYAKKCPECVDQGYVKGPNIDGKLCDFHLREARND